jgi:hypothetical protein
MRAPDYRARNEASGAHTLQFPNMLRIYPAVEQVCRCTGDRPPTAPQGTDLRRRHRGQSSDGTGDRPRMAQGTDLGWHRGQTLDGTGDRPLVVRRGQTSDGATGDRPRMAQGTDLWRWHTQGTDLGRCGRPRAGDRPLTARRGQASGGGYRGQTSGGVAGRAQGTDLWRWHTQGTGLGRRCRGQTSGGGYRGQASGGVEGQGRRLNPSPPRRVLRSRLRPEFLPLLQSMRG